MIDAVTALDQISENVARLTAAVTQVRTKTVQLTHIQPIAREIAKTYFESVRNELTAVQDRAGLVEEIDFVLQSILQLATAAREKDAYLGQITEVRAYL